ncbi:hypothetical protein HanXRQr2_Chr05g0202751 [Helianthus annuus]|uniref:Uncharacterized protein n=1 Tax=Helianthus annuus TaxID=4232 RepID=A0A9K3IY52_HELAN|nr:hypothetical protein HanXRQr2_Chr05g0202751 [Helianthus annuus]
MSTFFTKIYILVILSIIPSKPKIYVRLQEKEHFFLHFFDHIRSCRYHICPIVIIIIIDTIHNVLVILVFLLFRQI